MAHFEFDSKTGANNNRKNGLTRHGAIEINADDNLIYLDIYGPQGGERGGALLDKDTARQVGVALLERAKS